MNMKWFPRPAIAIAILACLGPALGANGAQSLMEELGRGLVGVHQPAGKVFLIWRLLGTDPEGVGFNVYRKTEPAQGRGNYRVSIFDVSGAAVQINSQVITGGTWFVDFSASLSTKVSYYVKPV